MTQYHVTYRIFGGAARTGIVKWFRDMSATDIRSELAKRQGYPCRPDVITIVSITKE